MTEITTFWSIEDYKAYAKQLRDKTRANTAEHAAEAIDYLLNLLSQGYGYEKGFLDGAQHQMKSSVDKAVNSMAQRTWVGLTDKEIKEIWLAGIDHGDDWLDVQGIARAIEAKLKERNT